ncbi:MAG TPA: hypothetical protein PLU49_04525 [Saprospiraceae bacterium]|nr:hypothetical protein [Saprospirales bacterium]HRQ29316.1 hypothetical protein [Saprospiraceae bacterium]
MYRKILLLGILFQFAGFMILYGQDICVPSETYADSSAGVYPLPFHEVLFPDGGIHDTVCIGSPFEYTFTAVLEDSIAWMGFSFKLNSLEILPNGVLNLPEGLQYGCNPPNCVFQANTMGCLKIYGTTTEANDPGLFDLQLRTKIVVANGLISVIDTLPELLVPGSHYYLPVEAASSSHCQTSSLYGYQQNEFLEIKYQPLLERLTVIAGDPQIPWLETEIIDMTGKVLLKQRIQYPVQSMNTMDVSGLSQGLYFCRTRTIFGYSGLKFVVSK